MCSVKIPKLNLLRYSPDMVELIINYQIFRDHVLVFAKGAYSVICQEEGGGGLTAVLFNSSRGRGLS